MISTEQSTQPGHLIVYVIGALNVGGSERHLVDIAPALVARGHRIAIHCLTERGVMAGALADSGIEVLGPVLEPKIGSSGRFGRALRFALSTFALFRLLCSRRPAIVHCFLPMANIVGIVLGRLSFRGCIVATRRSLNRYQQRSVVFGRMERLLNRCADVVVANSQAAARELVQDEAVPERRVAVIHNGLPLSRMKPQAQRSTVRQLLGIGRDDLVFIIVANLIGYKGHLDLVAALARISQSLPERWLLLIVGRDDGFGAPVLQASRDAKIEEHVRLLGARYDIPDLLNASDIGVLCSHEEGFPNAVLEYMAAGLPVVATDVGGTREAVDETTGHLVPAHNPAALGEALRKLAGDSAERKRLGEAGRNRVSQQFSLESCVSAYERLYRQLLRQRAAS